MKILFLQDLDVFTNVGGAEQNDCGIIKDGFMRGHDIRLITPNNVSVSDTSCDLMIISNCVSFLKNVLKDLCSKHPYIFFHHDYNFCSFRLYAPGTNKCRSCPNGMFWLDLYKNAKLHVWLSPLHREGYLRVYPELSSFRKVIIPSCVDIERFKPVEGVERVKNSVIGVNCLEVFKGRYNIYDYAKAHPELNFTFIGKAPGINLPNCVYLPYVKNEELPKIFSQFEYYIHLPRGIEPFSRTSMEALLCGCKLISNKNLGSLSYPWNFKNLDEVRNYLSMSKRGFWEEIERVFDEKIKKD